MKDSHCHCKDHDTKEECALRVVNGVVTGLNSVSCFNLKSEHRTLLQNL